MEPTEGNDTFTGGDGPDTYDGLGGADSINGAGGNDTLSGSAGNDTLRGSTGDDSVSGGTGLDTFRVNPTVDGSDSVNLGDGADLVEVSGSGNIRITFTSMEIGNGNANDGGTLAGQDGGLAVRLQLEDGTGTPTGPVSRYDDEGIVFASFSATFDVRDLISGAARGEQFSVVGLGTSETDIVAGTFLNDYANAGGGNDSLTGEAGNDFLVGGAGDDTLSGGVGNDSFIGGFGLDSITGGAGSDRLIYNITTEGADSFDGGADSDVVVVSAGTTASPVTAGQIRVSFTSSEVGNGAANDSNSTSPPQDGGLAVRLQLEDGSGAPGGTVLRTDDEGTTFLSGTPGVTFDVRDLVSGAARGDAFEIVVLGTNVGDNQTAINPTAAYYFNGGQGNDTISGGSANDFLVGGANDDLLTDVAGGADSAIGGGGNDSISLGFGDDLIAAFNVTTDGADSVDLGSGNDVVIVSASSPTNVRLTFTSAEVGNGSANDGSSTAPQDGGLAVRLQAETGGTPGGSVSRFDDEGTTFVGGAGVTFDVRDLVTGAARGEGFEVVTLGTSGEDRLSAVQAARPYYFNAGGGNDSVTGGTAADFLVGGGGDDFLLGGVGADSFLGGAGNDRLNGEAGADVLNGGAGRDVLRGGEDGVQDTFVYLATADSGVTPGTRDVIQDFDSGEDKIDLRAFAIADFDDQIVLVTRPNGVSLAFVDTDDDGDFDLAIQSNADAFAEGDFLL